MCIYVINTGYVTYDIHPMSFFGNQKGLKTKPNDVAVRNATTDLFGDVYTLKNERQEWQTPPSIFKYFDDTYKLNHDACASKLNHLKPNYWTAEDDALIKDWKGKRVWCNPPWGSSMRDLTVWSDKACREGLKDDTLVCFLFPLNTASGYFYNTILKAKRLYTVTGNPIWTRYDSKGQLLKAKLPFSTAVAIFTQHDHVNTNSIELVGTSYSHELLLV